MAAKNKIMKICWVVSAAICTAQAVEYTAPLPYGSTTTPPPKEINIPYARDYFLIGKGRWDPQLAELVKKDEAYARANAMLTNPSTFITKDVPAVLDPEAKEAGTKKQAVPDYRNAIKELVASAKGSQNPVSAYEAVTIALRMYGKTNSSPIAQDMLVLTKLLYNYGVCDGYVLYGESLERSGQRAAAYDVYSKGTSEKKCSGWYQSVLGGKLSTYKQAR